MGDVEKDIILNLSTVRVTIQILMKVFAWQMAGTLLDNWNH